MKTKEKIFRPIPMDEENIKRFTEISGMSREEVIEQLQDLEYEGDEQ